MLKSLSTSLIARGTLAMIIGVMALAWPRPTALILVLIVRVAAARRIAGGRERDRRGTTLAGRVRRATVRTMRVRRGATR